MTTFLKHLGIGIVSAVHAFSGAFHAQPAEIITPTPPTATTTSVSTTTSKTPIVKKVTAPKTSIAAKVVPVAPVVISTPAPIRDYKTLFEADLLPKYTKLRDEVVQDVNDLPASNIGQLDDARQVHLVFLNKLQVSLNNDIGVLEKEDPSTYDTYAAKFDQVIASYNNDHSQYDKNLVVDYLYNHKNSLYLTQTHIQVATLLNFYDKEFGTSYADEFRLLTTQAQTTEFANSFFMDIGRPVLVQ